MRARADRTADSAMAAAPALATPPADLIAAIFRCPACAAPVRLSGLESGRRSCAECGSALCDEGGLLDLVGDPERDAERAFYEEEWLESELEPTTLEELQTIWSHPGKPVIRALARHLRGATGRRILVVGNGNSTIELGLLLNEPELLIISDLTASGPAAASAACVLDDSQRSRLCLAAIDALSMPIADGSVDLVYAREAVHHLPDRERFLAEVVRVLRPGGSALFSDPAYSSGWQFAKRFVLRPLFEYSHRRRPRSPEDVRETKEGGFREEEIAATVRTLGAEAWFERQGLLYYLWRRASLVLFPSRFEPLGELRVIAAPLTAADRMLARWPPFRRQLMRMVWGLRVPPEPGPR